MDTAKRGNVRIQRGAGGRFQKRTDVSADATTEPSSSIAAGPDAETGAGASAEEKRMGDLNETTPAVPPASATPGLDSLAAEAARLDQEGIQAFGGPEPAPEAAPAPEVTTAEVLRPLMRAGFDILAPKWKVSDEESSQLATAYAAVLDKYFPDGVMGRWGAEFNAIILTVAIVGPRLKIAPRDVPKEKPEAAPRSAVELAPEIH